MCMHYVFLEGLWRHLITGWINAPTLGKSLKYPGNSTKSMFLDMVWVTVVSIYLLVITKLQKRIFGMVRLSSLSPMYSSTCFLQQTWKTSIYHSMTFSEDSPHSLRQQLFFLSQWRNTGEIFNCLHTQGQNRLLKIMNYGLCTKQSSIQDYMQCFPCSPSLPTIPQPLPQARSACLPSQ